MGNYTFGLRRRLILDDCPRLFPPRESGYWIYIASAEQLEHLSVANNPHFGDQSVSHSARLLRPLNLHLRIVHCLPLGWTPALLALL